MRQVMPTGVSGLDTVLGGGIEPGSTTIVAGPSGAGKTILGHRICFANATQEHRAVYYTTLAEPHSKLVDHMEQFAFFDTGALGSRVEYLHLSDFIRPADPEWPGRLFGEVNRKVLEEEPGVVVIDSAKVLRDTAGEAVFRMALYGLTSVLSHTRTALLLLGEYLPPEIEGAAEFSMADNIVQLAYQSSEPIDHRWLRAVKMRGARHLAGKHKLRISSAEGIEVFPRIETLYDELLQAAVGPPETVVTGRIPAGIPGLDPMMGGGIHSGEATAVLGPSGIGKTIFGLQFATEGVTQGERCLYVTFQDTPEQLLKMADGLGWNLTGADDRDQFVIHHVPLGELDLDILSGRIRAELARAPVGRVVIDSLAEMVFAARESERFPAFARSLTGIIRSCGASLLVTSETPALGPVPDAAGGILFLFHNVVLLRYMETDSAIGRAVNVLKMRNSDHSKNVHQFHITGTGLTIGPELDSITGVLGWTALRSPNITGAASPQAPPSVP